MNTIQHDYGRLAFWAVVAMLATITATSAVRLRQWACEPYITLPAPMAFTKARIEPCPVGDSGPVRYPARVVERYGLDANRAR